MADDIPKKVYRDLATIARQAVTTWETTTHDTVAKYDQAVLNGDDDARDKEAIAMVMFFIIGYVSLGGAAEKIRTVIDTVKAMQEEN